MPFPLQQLFFHQIGLSKERIVTALPKKSHFSTPSKRAFSTTNSGNDDSTALFGETPTARAVELLESQPRNEGRIHFQAKQHLMKHLKHAKSVDVVQFCDTRQEIEFLTQPPYFTCTNKNITHHFISGWTEVKSEYSVSDIGRFDIALIRKKHPVIDQKPSRSKRKTASVNNTEKANLKDDDEIVGVIEVLSTSKMKDYKVQRLLETGIPWIEVKANRYSMHLWNSSLPLIAHRISTGHWWCRSCKDDRHGNSSLKFIGIPAAVDIFPSVGTRNGYGKMHRKVFGIYEREHHHHDHDHHIEGEHLEGRRNTSYCLTVGTYEVIGSGHLHYHESFLIGEAKEIEDLKPLLHDFIESLRHEKEGQIVDIQLDWPGKLLGDFFDHIERTTFIDVNRITSPQVIYPTIERFFRPRYWWSVKEQSWKRRQGTTQIVQTVSGYRTGSDSK